MDVALIIAAVNEGGIGKEQIGVGGEVDHGGGPEPAVEVIVEEHLRRPPEAVISRPHLFSVVRAAFGYRRKTLRNALADVVPAAAFEAANVDPQRRGETLSVAEFVALADAAGAVI